MRDRERERERARPGARDKAKGQLCLLPFVLQMFLFMVCFRILLSGTKCSACQTESGEDGALRRPMKLKKGKANRDILHLLFLFSFSSFRESKIERESKKGVREEEIVELMFFYVSPRLLARFFLFAVCFQTPVDGIMFLPRQTESGIDEALIRPI